MSRAPGPRTVLILTPSARLLGARRSLLQLATNLDPARWRPVVVSQSDGALVDALREAGVETHVLFLGWWRKGRYMLQRPLKIRALARLARRAGASLLHCNEFHPNPYAVRAARLAGALPVATHMRLSITPRQIENYDLARSDRVVCVSHAAARDFDACPWREERVCVVYNGVDLKAFQTPLSRAEARERLGLAPDDFVAGMFALVSPRKRQHLLIHAAAALRGLHDEGGIPRPRILIVGSPGRSDGPYAATLEALVAEKRLGEAVRFIPFTPDVVEIYRACDANVLVSSDEGFGRTIIEAGALGVPSVGARVGGIPELIDDGRTGHLVPGDDDPAPLAEALEALACYPAAARRLGAAARERVAAEFSIEKHAERMMDLYDALTGEETD